MDWQSKNEDSTSSGDYESLEDPFAHLIQKRSHRIEPQDPNFNPRDEIIWLACYIILGVDFC